MEMLYMAHSGLRYLVLLAAVAAVAYYAFALATKRHAGASRLPATIFAGVLDLQILLGLILLTMRFYPALIGHLFMMVLAAAAAHVTFAMARKGADAERALKYRLLGSVLALLLIVFGILAIRNSVFESIAPGPLS